jgi:hypothetical protein
MMQPSTFDEALALPFLTERTQKKKWSFRSSTTSTGEANTAIVMLDDDDDDYDEEDPFARLASTQEAEELIHTETIVFGDDALIQERHGEIMGINDSLKQINNIHQGKEQQPVLRKDEHPIRSWFQQRNMVKARMEGNARFNFQRPSSLCCCLVWFFCCCIALLLLLSILPTMIVIDGVDAATTTKRDTHLVILEASEYSA